MADDLEKQIAATRECLACVHEGVLVTSTDGLILEANPGAERILETPFLILAGRNIREVYVLPEMYTDLIGPLGQGGRTVNNSAIVACGSGKKKILNISVQSVGDGADQRYVHVFQDCSDLRTMEDRLIQSERLATIGRFASQIAHEVRNPLSSITLNLEMLQDELTGASGEAKKLIQSVLKELDRLNDVVSEYLQFSRLPKPNPKRGTVQELLQELVGHFKVPGHAKLQLSLGPANPELWFDARLLQQVLENLILNAADAIEDEGWIRLETEVIARFFAIHVRDNGYGISAELQKKLFQPFFTTKAHGTGLGLATSQQIVFEHNGHLVVESEPGKGSTFTVLLPL